MRILYLSQLVPYPPDAGPKVRSYHVLQYLAAQGHEVTLVAFRRSSDPIESMTHLRSFCAAVHTVPMVRSRARDMWHLGRSVLRSEPFLIARDHVAEMHDLIDTLLSSSHFDAVHADQLWMAPYALAARKHSPAGPEGRPRLILDQHNAVYLVPRRLAEGNRNPLLRRFLQREAAVLEQYERAVCAQFDEVVWVTDEDRKALANGSELMAAGVTIPICVDPNEKRFIERAGDAHRVTFLGGLHWPPNAAGMRWFVEQVWPRILTQSPHASLTIIGKNPPAEFLATRVPGLEVTGFVADLTPYLAETAAFIVPLHAGGGMRVKIIDAWSWGMPIVSTTIGAEGLTYNSGENLLLEDSADAFAEAVIQIIREPSLGERLARAGRTNVESFYDWHEIYKKWDVVYGQ